MAAIQLASFGWKPDVNGELYAVDGKKTTFKKGTTGYYLPSVANVVFQPNTGKYYYEMTINLDNIRVGLCTPNDMDATKPLGVGKGLYSLNMQTGACEADGKELKRLWRIVTPCVGGRLGFLWDSDNGTLQGWFNGEFIGTMFHEAFGLKGKAVSPCVGIAGVETNNRNIGEGMKCAVIEEKPASPPKVYQ